jgi:hypothetical protein
MGDPHTDARAPASAAPPSSAQAPAVAPEPLFPVARSWKVASVVAVVMVLLALLGVGLATAGSGSALVYWIALVPIYGALCVSTATVRAPHGHGYDRAAVLRQLFHWLGIAVALSLDFLVRGTGEETGAAAGLNALLLLALGCYLAGIHLERLFIVVGVLLSLTVVCAAKAQEYLWVIFIAGGIAIAVIFALRWVLHLGHPAKGASALPSVPAAP